MSSLPVQPVKSGVVNLPGATPESTELVGKLVHKDLERHCFWNEKHFSNHLSHHLLSLYDLGAPASHIQATNDRYNAILKPLNFFEKTAQAKGKITEENWTTRLGDAAAYPDYLAFFSLQISKDGVPAVLDRYVFSPEANANGSMMLFRFVSGLLHPIIQAGFGIEFGQDFMVAQGLGQAAVTPPMGGNVMDLPGAVPEIQTGASSPSLLSLLREVYESPALAPSPYDAEPINGKRVAQWMSSNPAYAAEIRRIYSKWRFNTNDPEDIKKKIEECHWQATLLLGATGRKGKKPRMDFLFMHFLTGSIFLSIVLEVVRSPIHKAQLLQTYVRLAALFIIFRGRPRIDPGLVMSYSATPTPPNPSGMNTSTLGIVGGASPWLAVLNNAALHHEPHVVKAIRALYYFAQHYGNTPAGGVIGAHNEAGLETHSSIAKMDGTVFIRVAGVLTDALAWVSHGEEGEGVGF
ncbi:hypothetical protein C8J57DRAFT_1177587 [Mycena rebaudengoi]|nr:hypothetical protein C8J57DRAFT_1177587 [Mycena rebaudengoi]